jgi:hypothetical protein
MCSKLISIQDVFFFVGHQPQSSDLVLDHIFLIIRTSNHKWKHFNCVVLKEHELTSTKVCHVCYHQLYQQHFHCYKKKDLQKDHLKYTKNKKCISLPQDVQNPNTYCSLSTLNISITILIITRTDGKPNTRYSMDLKYLMILRKGWLLHYTVRVILVSSEHMKDIRYLETPEQGISSKPNNKLVL